MGAVDPMSDFINPVADQLRQLRNDITALKDAVEGLTRAVETITTWSGQAEHQLYATRKALSSVMPLVVYLQPCGTCGQVDSHAPDCGWNQTPNKPVPEKCLCAGDPLLGQPRFTDRCIICGGPRREGDGVDHGWAAFPGKLP